MTSPLRFAVTVVLDAGGTAVVDKRGVDARSAAALRHERAVLEHISHPGLVELAPTPPDAEPPPLRTFLAGGANLADRPPATVEAIARAGAQVASTLADLHRAGWAHGGVAGDHLVVGQGGAIVLCSLRRATSISGSDHAAARRDVTDLVEVIAGWRRAAGSRRDRAWSQLDHVLAAAARHPDAGELAVALAALVASDRPAPGRRRRPPRAGRVRRVGRATDPAPPIDPTDRQVPELRAGLVGSVAGLAAAAAALVLLLRLGVGTRPSGPAAAALWVATATLRWVGVATSGAWIAAGMLTLLALTTRDERLARAAARVGPRRVRAWAIGLTSLGLAGTVAAPSSTVPPATSPVHPEPGASDARPTPSLHPVRPTTTTLPASTTPMRSTAPPPPVVALDPAPVPPVAAPDPPAAPATWTVRRGDHLWGIAAATLRLRTGRDVPDHEVRRFWLALVAANRDRLVDPANPDLIFAGQVVVLPAA